MSITYSLINSPIPTIPGKIAQVPRGKRISLTDMATQMAERTGISKLVIQAVLSGLEEEVVSSLRQGNNPDIGLGIFTLSLGGTFESSQSVITPANADLRMTLRPSARFRQRVAANQTYTKVPASPRLPLIEAIYDVQLAAEEVFTPGGVVRILGEDLDFNESEETEGVFLTAADKTFRVTNYNRTGSKLVEVVATRELFIAHQAKSILPTGVTVTVKTTYGSQTLREGSYSAAIYRATFGGSVQLTDYVGVTGEALVRAIRDDEGPGIKLAYEEHGKSAFGTAVAVSGTEVASYTLLGNEIGNSLTVSVNGLAFYKFIEQSGIVNGESLNLPVDVF
jgi:hypothetical protein